VAALAAQQSQFRCVRLASSAAAFPVTAIIKRFPDAADGFYCLTELVFPKPTV
jgi:hypothetical protein